MPGGRTEQILNAYREKDRDRGRAHHLRSEFPIWRAREGENIVTIIPPKDLDIYFGHRIWVHYGIGVNRDSFICLAKYAKKRDPICEMMSRLLKSGREWQSVQYLNPAERVLVFILDRYTRKTENEGLQLWECPKGVEDELLSLSVPRPRRGGARPEPIDVSDRDNGRDFYFTRVGTDQHTNYKTFGLEAWEKEDRPDPTWWDEAPENFDGIPILAEYETMQEALVMAVEEEEGEEPSRRRGADRDDDAPRTRRDTSGDASRSRQDTSEDASRPRRDVDDDAPRTRRERPAANELPADDRLSEPAEGERRPPAPAEENQELQDRRQSIRDRLDKRRREGGEG